MEKADYRDNLMLIRERFGDKLLIPMNELAEALGVDKRSLQKTGIVKKVGGRYFVPAVAAAKYLS